MDAELKALFAKAKQHPATPETLEAQRISFAFSNANFEDPRVTMEIVLEQARKLKEAKAEGGPDDAR